MSTSSSAGCVVLLIDESAGMGAVMRETVADGSVSTKSNAERVATSINSLLNQLSSGPSFDLALVGYQADNAGQVKVGSRWGGSLAGRDFVAASELAAAPVRTESRTRKLPVPGGGVREEPFNFPIWYEPVVGAKAPQIAAFNHARELITRWYESNGSATKTPLVIHVFSGSSADGNPMMAINKILELKTPGGSPLLFQAHVAAKAELVPAIYPSNMAYLTVNAIRDLFRRASALPEHLVASLRASKVTINKGARGMLYNAKIGDVIRLLGLVKAHVKDWGATAPAPAPAASAPAAQAAQPATAPTAAAPEPAAAQPAPLPDVTPVEDTSATDLPSDLALSTGEGEKIGLVVFVLDRSVADPYSGDTQNPCVKLQDHANDLLRQISKLKEGAMDTAIVSYGMDSAGQPEVRDSFEGPLAGKSIVAFSELADGAIRVDEYEEQMSNGVGGLITMNRKKPIYFDLEPTAAAAPADAFAAAGRIIGQWRGQHPATSAPPIVLHLTRGANDASSLDQAAAALKSGAGDAVLYHLVATESPHPSVAYPDSAASINDSAVQKLWELTSPLLDIDRISAEKPTIKSGARGMVVNGKFDMLLEGVKNSLATV